MTRTAKYSHKARQSGSYAARPKTSLRWGRIVLTLATLCAGVAGIAYITTPRESIPTTSKQNSQMASTPTADGALPGDIFSNSTITGKPIVDLVLIEAVTEREQEKKHAQAKALEQNATLSPPTIEPSTTSLVAGAVQGNVSKSTSSISLQAQPIPPVTPASPLLSTTPTKTNPFAGKSLNIVTAELATQKFIGNTPVEWGEHLLGVTDHLSHGWKLQKYSQPQRYGATTQTTAKAVTNAPATIALTFDACGGSKGSGYDEKLITFLRANALPATLFFTSSWIKKNPAVFAELARDPLFEIAAHGTAHRPLSINSHSAFGITGTKNLNEIVKEVEANARYIEEKTGKRPRWFRSGTAHYDDIAVTVVRELGFGIAGYSITADEGATLRASKVTAKLLQAQDGDIILLHMNQPKSGTRQGLIAAIPLLQAQGFAFVHLSEKAQ